MNRMPLMKKYKTINTNTELLVRIMKRHGFYDKDSHDEYSEQTLQDLKAYLFDAMDRYNPKRRMNTFLIAYTENFLMNMEQENKDRPSIGTDFKIRELPSSRITPPIDRFDVQEAVIKKSKYPLLTGRMPRNLTPTEIIVINTYLKLVREFGQIPVMKDLANEVSHSNGYPVSIQAVNGVFTNAYLKYAKQSGKS